MNKVININLAGRLIVIDEHAYHTLYGYLENLKKYFGREKGGNEIIHDMEDRIGELFQAKIKKGKSCIMEEDVQEVINIMGLPEQIENETAEKENSSFNESQSHAHQQFAEDTGRKQLYRNKNDKTISGVCSGLADYFNVDVLIVRLLFVIITLAWGTGLLVYVVLWLVLPVNTGYATRFKKKIYRNPQNKIIGGVCSGLSAYLNTDVIILRLLFVLPLLSVIFFSIVGRSYWIVSLSGAAIPTSILIYIVLWIIIPKATTLTEQLEMSGENIDVQNLSEAIKQRESIGHTGNNRNGLESFIRGIFKVFLFIVLAIVIIVLVSIIIAVIASLFALKTSSLSLFSIGNVIAPSSFDNYVFWISLALVMLIPSIACIRLIVRLISGRPGNRWVGHTLAFGFIAAVFGLFWVSSEVVAEFSNKRSTIQNLYIAPPDTDTLIIQNSGIEFDGNLLHVGNDFRIKSINIDDTTLVLMNVKLEIKESTDEQYRLSVKKTAYGRNFKEAEKRAGNIKPDYGQEGNVLYISDNILQSIYTPFRGEQLRYVLEIPKGMTFKVQGFKKTVTNVHFYGSKGYSNPYTHKWKEDVYYTMGEE